MNREQKTKAIVMLDALAGEAKRKSAAIRAELEDEARAEYDREGNAPTWRFPNLGRVVLPLTEQRVVVDDSTELLTWVAVNHPEQVQVETREAVRPAFVTWLCQHAQPDGEVAHIDGEVIPGLRATVGGQPKSLAITPDRATKTLLGEVAEQGLLHLAAGPLSGVLALPGGDES